MRDEIISTWTKRKVIITSVDITRMDRFRIITLNLPANAKRITGILVTTQRVPVVDDTGP